MELRNNGSHCPPEDGKEVTDRVPNDNDDRDAASYIVNGDSRWHRQSSRRLPAAADRHSLNSIMVLHLAYGAPVAIY